MYVSSSYSSLRSLRPPSSTAARVTTLCLSSLVRNIDRESWHDLINMNQSSGQIVLFALTLSPWAVRLLAVVKILPTATKYPIDGEFGLRAQSISTRWRLRVPGPRGSFRRTWVELLRPRLIWPDPLVPGRHRGDPYPLMRPTRTVRTVKPSSFAPVVAV